MNLSHYRVLVIEDDYFLATEIAAALEEHGATVLGPVPDIDEGRRLASELSPDCVLLDVNLRGTPAFSLAEEFQREGIPTILTTGYDSDAIPAHLQDSARLRKPIDLQGLVNCIRRHAFARNLQ